MILIYETGTKWTYSVEILIKYPCVSSYTLSELEASRSDVIS